VADVLVCASLLPAVAAALALLMLERNPGCSAATIYEAMRTTAKPMTSGVTWDRKTGYGFVDAPALLVRRPERRLLWLVVLALARGGVTLPSAPLRSSRHARGSTCLN
jgi:hypothetical protein